MGSNQGRKLICFSHKNRDFPDVILGLGFRVVVGNCHMSIQEQTKALPNFKIACKAAALPSKTSQGGSYHVERSPYMSSSSR